MNRKWLTAFTGWLTIASIALGLPARAGAAEYDLNREVVARIGERVITLGEFNKILPPDPQQPNAKIPAHVKKQRLHEIVGNMLYLEAARELKLSDDPQVKARIEEATAAILINEYLRRQVDQQLTVNEKEMKAYYKANTRIFLVKEQRRLRHILFRVPDVSDREVEAKARKRAEAALARARAGEDFAKLAEELSEDPGSKKKGGDVGYAARSGDATAKEFEDAAFALKLGEVSGLVRSEFGFHVIKLEEKQDSYVRSYESAREFIRLQLLKDKREERQQQLLAELKRGQKVELHPGVFDAEQ